VRLADWPRNPYLNEELREWVELHLRALGVQDIAVYAVASPRHDDERRILVATEAGLLDGWYAPRGSTARFSLTVRLVPWQVVHGVELRGETFRLWAHEHQSRWRLRIAQPAFDAMADDPRLGTALAEFAAACAVMAEPAGSQSEEDEFDMPRPIGRGAGPTAPVATSPGDVAENGRTAAAGNPFAGIPGGTSVRPAIHVEPMPEMAEPPGGSSAAFERRIGLRQED
jgi:hypothetical protein